jgi:uncharacterized protein
MKSKNKLKVVLAGGTGVIGKTLIAFFRARGADVKVLTRGTSAFAQGVEYIHWDARHAGPWFEAINGSDLLINLVGKSVNCRYTEKAKAEIIDSRVNATLALGAAAIAAHHPPKCWINLASATIYADAREKVNGEDGDIGSGFSVEVCKIWESTFNEIPLPTTRKVVFRTAFFLSHDGGVFSELARFACLGMGGKWGPGDQRVSWIHEDDFCNMVLTAFEDEWVGTFNASSPHPLPLIDFFAAIRKHIGRRIRINILTALVHLGARLKGTEAELILKSRNVVPTAALKLGFEFKFTDIRHAVANLLPMHKRTPLNRLKFYFHTKRSSFLPFVSKLN